MNLVTTKRTYINSIDPSILLSGDGLFIMNFSVMADMAIGDTAIVQIELTGGANQMDVSANSFFSGSII